MRKSGIYVLGIICLLAAACSKGPLPRKAGVTGGRVPISIGRSSSVKLETKSVVNDLEGLQFGVLALDPSKTAWSGADTAVLLCNKVFECRDGACSFVTPQGPEILYYPSYDCNYEFYAYHVSDEVVADTPYAQAGSFDSGTFIVDLLMGETDVLWAKSVAPALSDPSGNAPDLYGFNRDYIISARMWYGPAADAYVPHFTFSHLTSHITFTVEAESPEAEASLGSDFTVDRLIISDLPLTARLDVISGSLTAGEEYLPFLLFPDEPVAPSLSGQEIAGGVFILPGTETFSFRYVVSFDGQEYLSPEPIFVSSPDGTFKAGYNYKYRIIVRDRENVSIMMESMDRIIDFEDPLVRGLCVDNWDTDKDGELSDREAAAVTDLGAVFSGNAHIRSFDELRFFTGLSSLPQDAFLECASLESMVVPPSVTSIGASAFFGCPSLSHVQFISYTAPAIRGDIVEYSNRQNVHFYIPTAALSNYREAWGSLYTFITY